MTVRFTPLRPGEDPTEVGGNQLRARLGSGGMGTVYLSFSRGRRPIAIKVVKRELADNAEFRRRFAREITAAQQVQGHFTAPVVDADPEAPVPWLATAYIAGPSVEEAVAEHGPFPLFTVYRLLAGAAEGIAAVHEAGLIHRDLKPANVLLAADGPRVIDFGIARAANSSTLTGRGSAIGTPGYMAPEQIRGRVTEATDVFGLGQLAMFAATGHPAFYGEGGTDGLLYRIINEPPDLDDCPAKLRPIVERCLAKDPAVRPSVDEVIDYARDAMRGETMRVLNEPWLPPPVVAALPSYDPSAAPPPPTAPDRRRPSAPTTPVVPVVPPRRSLLRPVVAVPVVLILAVGGFLGYQIGHSGSGPGPDPGPSGRGSAPATQATTAAPPASTVSPPPTTSPTPPPPTNTAVAYPPEWGGKPVSFTMPGGSCTSYFPSSVTFDATQGPLVNSSGNENSGDMFMSCIEGGEFGQPAALSFNSHQVAKVTGSPSAGDCVTAISRTPLPNEDISLPKLSAGMQFCLTDKDSNQVVLLALTRVDQLSRDLAWTATAWSLISS